MCYAYIAHHLISPLKYEKRNDSIEQIIGSFSYLEEEMLAVVYLFNVNISHITIPYRKIKILNDRKFIKSFAD